MQRPGSIPETAPHGSPERITYVQRVRAPIQRERERRFLFVFPRRNAVKSSLSEGERERERERERRIFRETETGPRAEEADMDMRIMRAALAKVLNMRLPMRRETASKLKNFY